MQRGLPLAFPFGAYTGPNILANVALIHGFVPSANNDIVPGGWSIGTETAFYAIFPLLFTALRRIKHDRAQAAMIAFLSILALNLAMQIAIWRTTHSGIDNDTFLYYNLLNQLPAFVLGMAYFAGTQEDGPFQRGRASRAKALGAFLVCTAINVALWKSGIALAFAVIPAVGAASFVCLLHWLMLCDFRAALPRHIGRASYSMYIFHFIFASIMVPSVASRAFSMLNPPTQLILSFAINVLATFALARFTERAIEARGIRVGSRVVAYVQGAQSVAFSRS